MIANSNSFFPVVEKQAILPVEDCRIYLKKPVFVFVCVGLMVRTHIRLTVLGDVSNAQGEIRR